MMTCMTWIMFLLENTTLDNILDTSCENPHEMMTLAEAAKFKQAYWALEAKYKRWPPVPNVENADKLDESFAKERDELFASVGCSGIRMVDVMSLSYNLKPDMIAEMVNQCAASNPQK